MNLNPYIYVALVSICNIGLNLFILKAAKTNDSFSASLLSEYFVVAFSVGMVSILSMLAFYKSEFNLAQGLIIMGATSILFGSMLGLVYYKNKIDAFEAIILIAILILYILKFIKTLQMQ